MELIEQLHSEIDTGRPVPPLGADGEGAVFIKDEIERVQQAIDDVGQALQELPPPKITTLPLAQLMIRNGTEVSMMSEGDLVQEIANVTAGILRCDELLADEDHQSDPELSESLKSLAQDLQIISAREASAEDDQIYCLCKLPYSATRSMIQCDVCDNWYHLICIGLSLLQLPPTYQCPLCQIATTRRRRRSDPMDIPDNVVQPDVELKLCLKGIDWLQEEINKTESELAEVVVNLDVVQSDLAVLERNERNRAARASRKAAKEAIKLHGDILISDSFEELDNVGSQKSQRKRRRR